MTSQNGQSVKRAYAPGYFETCAALAEQEKDGDGLAYVRADCLRTLLAEREELRAFVMKIANTYSIDREEFSAQQAEARRLVGVDL